MPTFNRYGRYAAIPLIAFAIIGAVLLVESSRDAGAAGPCTSAGAALDGEELDFIARLNAYRAQNSLPALATSPALTNGAAWMAIDLGGNPVFGHTDTLGRSAAVRAADCGYTGGVGENIAAGTDWDTGAEAFAAWQNSAGHNANMLGASYVVVGVGRAFVPGSTFGWYWVAMFGQAPDTGSSPTATPSVSPTGTATGSPTTGPTTPAASPSPSGTPPRGATGTPTTSGTPGAVGGPTQAPRVIELPTVASSPSPSPSAAPTDPPGDPRTVPPVSPQDLPRIPAPFIQPVRTSP